MRIIETFPLINATVRGEIPIARGPAAARLPRFRALGRFGRRRSERVVRSSLPASENLHRSGHTPFRGSAPSGSLMVKLPRREAAAFG
jgi:hypothetical protein